MASKGFLNQLSHSDSSTKLASFRGVRTILLPCPSFPWLFCFYQGRPPNFPRVFFPCRERIKTLENQVKIPVLTRKFLAKNQPRKSKQSRKGRTGFCALPLYFPTTSTLVPHTHMSGFELGVFSAVRKQNAMQKVRLRHFQFSGGSL